MGQRTIAQADVDRVAEKLEGLRGDLGDHEYETLQAVFRLAGIGSRVEAGPAEADEPDVEGFASTPDKVEAASENVRRVGLSAQFSLGFALTPAAPSPLPLPYPDVG